MYQDLLNDSSLYQGLQELDEELAAECKDGGCVCGGRLHWARYRRKPRGGPQEAERSYRFRLSFCCGICRRRVTPPSVLFLARKVFFSAVVVLACALRHGAETLSISKLEELTGASRRTICRWLKWWKQDFASSQFWKAARGRLRAPADESKLPASLLDCFQVEPDSSRLVGVLRFIRPLSISTVRAGLGF